MHTTTILEQKTIASLEETSLHQKIIENINNMTLSSRCEITQSLKELIQNLIEKNQLTAGMLALTANTGPFSSCNLLYILAYLKEYHLIEKIEAKNFITNELLNAPNNEGNCAAILLIPNTECYSRNWETEEKDSLPPGSFYRLFAKLLKKNQFDPIAMNRPCSAASPFITGVDIIINLFSEIGCTSHRFENVSDLVNDLIDNIIDKDFFSKEQLTRSRFSQRFRYDDYNSSIVLIGILLEKNLIQLSEEYLPLYVLIGHQKIGTFLLNRAINKGMLTPEFLAFDSGLGTPVRKLAMNNEWPILERLLESKLLTPKALLSTKPSEFSAMYYILQANIALSQRILKTPSLIDIEQLHLHLEHFHIPLTSHLLRQLSILKESKDYKPESTDLLEETKKEISKEELNTIISNDPAYKDMMAHIQTVKQNHKDMVEEKANALADASMAELVFSELKSSQNKSKTAILKNPIFNLQLARVKLKVSIAKENYTKLHLTLMMKKLVQIKCAIANKNAAGVLALKSHIEILNQEAFKTVLEEKALQAQCEIARKILEKELFSLNEFTQSHLDLLQENLARQAMEKIKVQEELRQQEEKEKKKQEQAKIDKRKKQKQKKRKSKDKKKASTLQPSPTSHVVSADTKETETKNILIPAPKVPKEDTSEDWANLLLIHFKQIQQSLKLPLVNLQNPKHENYLALYHHIRRFFLAFYRYTNGSHTSKAGPCLPYLSQEIVHTLRNVTTHMGLTANPRIIINSAHILLLEMPVHLRALKHPVTGALTFNAADLKDIPSRALDPNRSMKLIFSDLPLYMELKDVPRLALSHAGLASTTLRILPLIAHCYANRNFAALETLISQCGEPVRLKALEKKLEKRIVEKDYFQYNNYCQFLMACKEYRNNLAHKAFIDNTQLSIISELAKQIDESWLLTQGRGSQILSTDNLSSTSTSSTSSESTTATAAAKTAPASSVTTTTSPRSTTSESTGHSSSSSSNKGLASFSFLGKAAPKKGTPTTTTPTVHY